MEESNFVPLGSEGYHIQTRSEMIDPDKKEVLTPEKIKNMDPWNVIVAGAAVLNLKINDPKKDCKHCYGRGYIGFQKNRQPIPCNCIFNKEDLKDVPVINHATKRKFRLEFRRRMKKMKRDEWLNKTSENEKVDEQ
ncbi:MAG TPA: hypothetical protein PLI22_03860 [Caldisericia bacterium]|nr:hypothetical protein [Caldisericia bacterium]